MTALPASPASPALTDWIGYAAAILTTTSFVPQAWHTFRSPDLPGVSIGMYATFTLGVALWLAYGVQLGEWPIIVSNTVTLALAALILARTVASRRRARR